MKKKYVLFLRFFVALSILVLIAAPFFVVPRLIKVTIKCQSQYGDCPQELTSLISDLNGKDLLSARKTITSRFSQSHSVSDFRFQFKLPDALIVSVLIKKPFAAIHDTASNAFFLCDTKGKILSILPESSLPSIDVDNFSGKPGETISEQNLFALSLISGVFQMYQVNSGKIADGSLVIELPGGERVIFPLQGESDILLGSLRLIYSRIESGGEKGKFSEIDLRYKNPILR